MLTTLLNNWGDSSVTLGCLSISHFHFASGLARWIQYFILFFFFKSMYGKRLILRVMEGMLNKILSSLVHYHSSLLLSFLDVHQPYWRAHFCKTYWCINWKITIYFSWFTSQPIPVDIPASVETVYLCKHRISGLDEELTSFQLGFAKWELGKHKQKINIIWNCIMEKICNFHIRYIDLALRSHCYISTKISI